ncbi:hypothetical protein BHE74_00026901 [Ensete ventricosum]|nr:hypothetical protein BHE74_00026901 [Ensete ventricosum]RZR96593.1 hypothetical protein BHM03_00025626 [Ensete ventricosum]
MKSSVGSLLQDSMMELSNCGICGRAVELHSPSVLVALTSKPIDRFLSCSCTLCPPHKDHPTNAYLPGAPMATSSRHGRTNVD